MGFVQVCGSGHHFGGIRFISVSLPSPYAQRINFFLQFMGLGLQAPGYRTYKGFPPLSLHISTYILNEVPSYKKCYFFFGDMEMEF